MPLYVIIMLTVLDIPAHLVEEIDAIARQEQISRAEAVRRAIADYLASRSAPRPDAGFGIWKNRGVDSVASKDKLRSEWNR